VARGAGQAIASASAQRLDTDDLDTPAACGKASFQLTVVCFRREGRGSVGQQAFGYR
jgi:hypothetical protein